MRYALIIAGGSGTRLWPLSTATRPKQLIPLIGGKSLLELAFERLGGLLDDEQIYLCAGEAHREQMLARLPGLTEDRFIGEPMGRDTLNAVALGVGVIARQDPHAVVAVFTADHLIEPTDRFQQIVDEGFALAEAHSNTLVTFGIMPTHAATGFGYLELGRAVEGSPTGRHVDQFKEKPDAATAKQYLDAGPQRYLWNSGMFVFCAHTLLDCVERFAGENHALLMEIVAAWDGDQREAVLGRVYPELRKISLDYAVMEPASRDEEVAAGAGVAVAAIPMDLRWLDVGSWPAVAATRGKDEHGNAAEGCQAVLLDTSNTLAVSDDADHLIAAIGCEGLIIIHTAQATLVCRADQAEKVKALHQKIGEAFGEGML